MKRVARLLALPRGDRRLLLSAAFTLGVVKLGLGIVRFRTLQRLLSRLWRVGSRMPWRPQNGPDRVGWAVRVASNHSLGPTTCLVQALTAQLLLVRSGYAARLHIGVAGNGAGSIEAHAWVESEGRVVVGGTPSELDRYTRLGVLTSAKPRP